MAATMTPPQVGGLAGAEDPRNPWRPSPQGALARLIVFGLIVVVALAAPLIVPAVQVNLVTKAFVFGLIALSMNVLTGYVGTVSLGHQAFVGMGAFTAGYVLTDLEGSWIIAAAVAILLGAAQAGIIGVVALRVQGFFFAIVTLAYGLFAKDVLFNISALTGGGAGQRAARPGFTIAEAVPGEEWSGVFTESATHASDVRFAWFALACLAAVWLLDWRLTSSRGGRAIQALRDDPRVAASWGINVNAFTMLAFMMSGAIAGLAGALFASTEQFVSAESFTLTAALTYVLMTTVGGVGSRPGVVIGGFVFAGLGPILTAMHDTVGWGIAETEGETIIHDVCTSGAARTVSFVFGLVLIGVGVEALRHLTLHKGPPLKRAVGVVLQLVALFIGLRVLLGGAFGVGVFGDPYCVFSSISALLEPVIGVVLLLVTLIQFPGGIAQQLEAPLRWLSFGRFHEESASSVGGGSAAGSSSMRP